jgi:hypothetical protein
VLHLLSGRAQASLLLYCCFTAALLLLYCCFTAALLLLHCCFTTALLLLHCCFTYAKIAHTHTHTHTLTYTHTHTHTHSHSHTHNVLQLFLSFFFSKNRGTLRGGMYGVQGQSLSVNLANTHLLCLWSRHVSGVAQALLYCWFFCCFTSALLLLYCCFTAALNAVYCCFTAALLLLYLANAHLLCLWLGHHSGGALSTTTYTLLLHILYYWCFTTDALLLTGSGRAWVHARGL